MRPPSGVTSIDMIPSGWMRHWARCVACLAVAWQLGSGTSAALEPRSLTEPDVLREPAAVTQVVDAFDQGGGIDFDFTLAYHNSWKAASIVRESQNPGIDATGIAHVEVTDF